MTEHAQRIMALALDLLDRTTARYRFQHDDYAAATELTLSRADYEELGRPTMLYATLSGQVPQLPAPDIQEETPALQPGALAKASGLADADVPFYEGGTGR